VVAGGFGHGSHLRWVGLCALGRRVERLVLDPVAATGPGWEVRVKGDPAGVVPRDPEPEAEGP
jgi:hypothetical protein